MTSVALYQLAHLDFDYQPPCELTNCPNPDVPATHMLRVDPPCGCEWVALTCTACTSRFRALWHDLDVGWWCVGRRHPFPPPLCLWASLEQIL